MFFCSYCNQKVFVTEVIRYRFLIHFNGRFFYSFSLLKMYPQKVYYCPCLKINVMMCLVDGCYSLNDIIYKIKNNSKVKKLFYCTRCGDQKKHAIFFCVGHMKLRTFLVGDNNLTDEHKNRCPRCIKKYLRTSFSCCYQYTKFDVPLPVKRQKKVLCLRLVKL